MLGRHWRLWLLLFWLVTCLLMVINRWKGIYWFSLPDTDDNMRMMQVRALLGGQDWYDLRQHRMSPPDGLNIHWSRIVDFPIAAIIMAMKPFVGGALAEKTAVAVAPMLPMLVALAAVGAAARRLLSPPAFMLVLVLLMFGHSARFMWTPLRIDHHGWQLAMLSLVILSFAVRRPAQAGALLGGASAMSLAIGLEMLLYLALAGALTVLLWIRDPEQRPRLFAYGASLAGGVALGYLVFGSYDNSAPVCDTLSPVWLSAMVAAGAIAVALSLMPQGSRLSRLAIAAATGALLAGAFALAWPHCLGRLEAVSPELNQLWLSKVREARSLWGDDLKTVTGIAGLPLAGLIGYGVMIWRERTNHDRAMIWASLGLMCLAATALLLWQARAGPAAQLLAVPGASALAWLLLPQLVDAKNGLVRIGGTVLAVLLISGFGLQLLAKLPDALGSLASALRTEGVGDVKLPQWLANSKGKSRAMKKVDQANRRCPTLPALHPIAKQPKGLVLTFVDLGPRLITVTHHDAIAGPYHRNGSDILDVIKTFRGGEQQARLTVERRGIDYVLICPWMSESTIYRSEAPKGFYNQLYEGKVPGWLAPVELPKNSPYRMWRVVRSGSSPESRQ